MRSSGCGVRSGEFGVGSSGCGVRSSEFGVRGSECRVRSVGFGVGSSECGMPDYSVVLGGNANRNFVTIGISDSVVLGRSFVAD